MMRVYDWQILPIYGHYYYRLLSSIVKVCRYDNWRRRQWTFGCLGLKYKMELRYIGLYLFAYKAVTDSNTVLKTGRIVYCKKTWLAFEVAITLVRCTNWRSFEEGVCDMRRIRLQMASEAISLCLVKSTKKKYLVKNSTNFGIKNDSELLLYSFYISLIY